MQQEDVMDRERDDRDGKGCKKRRMSKGRET